MARPKEFDTKEEVPEKSPEKPVKVPADPIPKARDPLPDDALASRVQNCGCERGGRVYTTLVQDGEIEILVQNWHVMCVTSTRDVRHGV